MRAIGFIFYGLCVLCWPYLGYLLVTTLWPIDWWLAIGAGMSVTSTTWYVASGWIKEYA